MGNCQLCQRDTRLVKSHIVPKFVFQWMKDTGTPFLRSVQRPNIRVQDGVKDHFLCEACEQLFSKSEKWFSEEIFHRYLSGERQAFLYDRSLPKFVVSILWRSLLLHVIDKDYEQSYFHNDLFNAFTEWRVYLLNGITPQQFTDIHLHFIPDEWGAAQPNPYVSRYFARAVDAHIIIMDEDVWAYVKFSRFMFFGRIKGSTPSFRNTRIDFTGGATVVGQFIDNIEISSYLMDRAQQVHEYFKKNLSAGQLKIIEDYTEKNAVAILQSDMGRRIVQDHVAEVNPEILHPSFNYLCDCCNRSLSAPDGYLLRTFEVINSKSYLTNLFANLQLDTSEDHLKARTEVFYQLAGQTHPWTTCDQCAEQFSFDQQQAKHFLNQWIES